MNGKFNSIFRYTTLNFYFILTFNIKPKLSTELCYIDRTKEHGNWSPTRCWSPNMDRPPGTRMYNVHVRSDALFIKSTNSRGIKTLMKKTAMGVAQTSENICSGIIQQVCTLAPFISLHVCALFLCQWTLYFFATSVTHLLFITVVKFLHSCNRASRPDPFYAGHKHNIYDPKFSVNKCYITVQKMKETFFYLLVIFYVFAQFRYKDEFQETAQSKWPSITGRDVKVSYHSQPRQCTFSSWCTF